MTPKRTIKLHTYSIVEDAVESGLRLGWQRAVKHIESDMPLDLIDPDMAQERMLTTVMEMLSEVVVWPEETET